ncbi:MAG: DsbA family protein [Caulobacterales bacterium]|nr:DsbA family protein [Caulobacterales bacterium]
MRRSLPALAVVAALGLVACQQKTASAVNDSEMSLGDPKAKITVVEYASVGCPFCAQFSNEIFPAFKAKYVDTGKARYVFREVLVGGGDEVSLAAAGFLMARCAGKDKYFPILEQTFRAQSSIYQSGDVRGGLLEIAKANGMNEAQFTSCISNDQSLIALNARSEQAAKDGVGSTPTFFINGKKAFEGLPTAEQLDKAIQAAQ